MITSVDDLIAERFRVRIAEEEQPSTLDADSTAKVMVNRNARRAYLIVINDSANAVRIWPFKGISTTRGIPVAANGGMVVLSCLEDFRLPTREWSVIAAADNSTITIIEGFIQAPAMNGGAA